MRAKPRHSSTNESGEHCSIILCFTCACYHKTSRSPRTRDFPNLLIHQQESCRHHPAQTSGGNISVNKIFKTMKIFSIFYLFPFNSPVLLMGRSTPLSLAEMLKIFNAFKGPFSSLRTFLLINHPSTVRQECETSEFVSFLFFYECF